MKVSYNWLQSYFDSPLPTPEKLAELLAAHLFDVEGIEQKNDDTIFEFKVLPDRAHYLLSHKGVAGEISAITGLGLKKFERTVSDTGGLVSDVEVTIENDTLCRRYIAREMNNVAVQASPDWLKERLEAVGQKNINNIVDAANYVMLDVGQPLHIFDADKIIGGIVVRLAKAGEKITILTGQEISLSEDNLVIADHSGPLAIAGVKGGKRAEVSDATKRIIIESANFDPTSIRKTSTKLNLRNDSSKRFENEITPILALEAMDDITNVLFQINSQATTYSIRDIYPHPVSGWQVIVSPKDIEAMIGVPVSETEIEKILVSMGCKVEKKKDQLTITPPADRLDMKIPEDIADEVGRIMGYEKLPTKLPPDLKEVLLPDKTFFYSEKAKNMLVDLGYSETILYALVPKGVYEIVYPLASDKSALREHLSTKVAEALILNGRNADLLSLETIKICEVGKVFRADGEKTILALGVLQIKKKKGITSEKILKGDIVLLEKALGVSLNPEYSEGEFGMIAEIDFDVVVAELPAQGKLSELGFKALPTDLKYQKFSQYPFIVRDIAIFVPESTKEIDVQELLQKNAGPLCIKINLFDVFTKDLPEGKKTSYAFRLIFQSFERTLEDKDVNEVMNKISAEIALQRDWQIR